MITVKGLHATFESVMDNELDQEHTIHKKGEELPDVGVVLNLLRIRELPSDIFTKDSGHQKIELMKSGYMTSGGLGEGPVDGGLSATLNVEPYEEFSTEQVVATELGEFMRVVDKLYNYEADGYDPDTAKVYAVSRPVNLADDDDAMVRYMSRASFIPPDDTDATSWDMRNSEIWILSAVSGEEVETSKGASVYYLVHLVSIRDVIAGVMERNELALSFLRMLQNEHEDERFRQACSGIMLRSKLADSRSGGSHNEQFKVQGNSWKSWRTDSE